MKIFIFSLLIGATLALAPTNEPNGNEQHRKGTNDRDEAFFGDFDWRSGSDPVNPAFYYVKNQPGFNQMVHVDTSDDGSCANNNNWVLNQFDKVDRAYGFRGCEYFTVTVVDPAPKYCISDIETCAEHGFTFVAEINPNRNEPETHYLANFGHGLGGRYGLYVGFKQDFVRIKSYTIDRAVSYKCKLNADPGLIEGEWYSLAIRRGLNDKKAQVKMYINGVRVGQGSKDCDRGKNKENNKPPTDTVREIIIGAAKDNGTLIDNPFKGQANQICLFPRMLGGAEIRWVNDDEVSGTVDAGCYWIQSGQSGRWYTENPN